MRPNSTHLNMVEPDPDTLLPPYEYAATLVVIDADGEVAFLVLQGDIFYFLKLYLHHQVFLFIHLRTLPQTDKAIFAQDQVSLLPSKTYGNN